MQMTNSEIAASYRLAADPKKQIGILADLNACTRAEIVDALKKEGVMMPRCGNGKEAKKVKTPEAAMQQSETPETPDLDELLAESERGRQRNAAERFMLEDVLALVFDAVDDYMDAPAENEVRSEAAFIGYLSGVKDTFAALRGQIAR